MCSFTEERLVCCHCSQLIQVSPVLFETCDPKPTLHCQGYKKRGAVRRPAPPDECSSCSRLMVEARGFRATHEDMMEALKAEEEICALIDAMVAEEEMKRERGEENSAAVAAEAPSNAQQPPAGCSWDEAKLEDYIKPGRNRRRRRASAATC